MAMTPTSSSPPTRVPPTCPTRRTQSPSGYGFWLGDAFASGGSNGYDHKKVGITARGAWVLVRRHFAERGIDPYNHPVHLPWASETWAAMCSATGC